MKKFILSILFLILSVTMCYSYEFKNYYTVYGTTNEEITAQWDNTENTLYNEITLVQVENNRETSLGRIESNEITFKLPRTGHYILKVRACYEGDVCSDWTESTSEETLPNDVVCKGWWLYGHIAKPGNITIE